MTPSLFTCAAGQQLSEIDIASGWGSTDSARAVLERHWDTFVNQTDFEYLAGIGINTVRLPIGYWSLGPRFCQDTPYEPVADVYQNSWGRVVRAINMAGDAGIGVLVDLHGAPGSQNGQQHSGVSDGATNLFDDPTYINITMSVLIFLMEELVNVTNVVGIQILNEPHNVPELPAFYDQAISAMRQVSPAAAAFPLYLHDGFNLDQFSDFVANRSDFVVEDHHSYFVFTSSDESEPASQHTADIQGPIANSFSVASAKQRRNLVIDEWSCALTDDSLSYEDDPDQARHDFCVGQMEVYTNTSAGWGFWAYNKEACFDDPGWCFRAAVGTSLPSSFFSYGQPAVTDPSQLPSLADLVSDMNTPPASQIIASAQETPTTSPSSYDPPSAPLNRRQVIRRHGASHHWRRRATSFLSQSQRRDGADMSPTQQSITRGYSDGFLTAKIFAVYGWSKLGFTGQYISDSIAKLGPSVVAAGTEGDYEEWFMKGLRDGEAIVRSHVNPEPQPTN
ncbi:glycoside hydrolase superfamily [Amylocystis lapponica]|nr:glycoside hydrolase superfamily [Amylocystis lapponica]